LVELCRGKLNQKRMERASRNGSTVVAIFIIFVEYFFLSVYTQNKSFFNVYKYIGLSFTTLCYTLL